MDIWSIFVLSTLRLGANIDFCRLTDYASSHREVRAFLGFSLMMWDEKYSLQTIKNNIPLITSATMDAINNAIVKLGHKQFRESQTKALKAKGDSFVMKTKVEYPTDIGLLEDGLPLVFPHIFRRNCINMANRLIQEIFLIFSSLKRQANLYHVEYNKHTSNM